MTTQEKKALARRVFDDIWSQGKLEVADELLSPDFVGHPGGLGEPFHGPEGAKGFIGRLRDGFPDIAFTVEEMVADGNVVATRWSSTATHEGEFMGYEPTEKRGTIGGMTFLRFENGTIVEGWTQLDAIALLKVIGAMREPARV